MSASRITILVISVSLAAVNIVGCATSEQDRNDMIAVQQQQQLPTSANNYQSNGAMMRHSLRELAEYDISKMQKLIIREINMNEGDENTFLTEAATTLGQTVFVQPDFTVRETALHDLKGRLEPEQYPIVLDKAADELLSILSSSRAPSDQAGALISLTNLVIEVRTLKKPEFKYLLQKIADANVKVTAEAKKYAVEPMRGLISPSLEAQSALKTL